MNQRLQNIIIFILLFFLAACEDIYDPKLEKRGNGIVAEARIIRGEAENVIKIRKSMDFLESGSNFPAAQGASVSLIDSNGDEYFLPEISTGDFKVDVELNPEYHYKIRIKHNDDIYESGFESVPQFPELDTLYGNQEKKVIDGGGINSVNDFREKDVIQCFLDVNPRQKINNYRFTWSKVTQYAYSEIIGDEEITHYVWFTRYPSGIFNLASPAQYKKDNSIFKHAVFYIDEDAKMPVDGAVNLGYIFMLYQYTLSESATKYYKDLNNQLSDDGQIFDPMYVQARNNLKCINNPDKIILGHFEISAMKETRYYIKNLSGDLGFILKGIPYFYDIPLEGDVIEIPPDFWESKSKKYP